MLAFPDPLSASAESLRSVRVIPAEAVEQDRRHSAENLQAGLRNPAAGFHGLVRVCSSRLPSWPELQIHTSSTREIMR